MKKETYKEKTRGVEHSSEDIENTRMKANSGLHSMSLQGVEKRRIFTLWIMSSVLYIQISTSI